MESIGSLFPPLCEPQGLILGFQSYRARALCQTISPALQKGIFFFMIVATHSVKAEVFCKFLSSECPSISFYVNRRMRLFREEDCKNV